jgi:hypothetical protein
MSLRIRRGTDAQRQTLTFDQGEVVYTTDTKKVYIGDGITAGGTNILATSAGSGVTFNATTQQFDFNTSALGITTSDVAEGSRKYFTTQRAQDAAAALFTATGSPPSSGTIVGTIATGTIVLNTADLALVNGTRMVIAGAGANGISAGTYYVVSSVGTSVVLANSLANATNGIQITGINTGSVTSTTYTAGGTDSGITFVYDDVNNVINVVSSGTTTLVNDTNPRLGANLGLNNFNVTGTGNINITGSGTFSSTLTVPTATHATKLNVDNINSISATGVQVSADGTAPLVVTGIGTLGPTSGQVYLTINAAKGTIAAPTTSAAGDGLGGIAIQGYAGGGIYKSAALIATSWDATATLSDTFPKSNLALITGGGGSILRQATLDYRGVFTAPVFQAANYATGSYPASPAKGWIIFDSTTNKFMGYNGTAWVAFTGP